MHCLSIRSFEQFSGYNKTGREYRRNRRHIHLTQEPPVTILNDDLIDESQPVTMQSSGNSPSVTRQSDANLEPDHPILMPPRLHVALLWLDLLRFGIRITLCKRVVL